MAITQFDKPVLRLLRVDLEAAIKAVAEKHGIELRVGNISFDPGSFTAQLKGRCGAADAQERELLLMACQTYGLDPEKESNGYKLVGYDPRKRAKPWKIEKGGTPYVCATDFAKHHFGRAAEAVQ